MNLGIVFDFYNKVNMELYVYQEIHDRLICKKDTIETSIQNILYENWMEKIKLNISTTDKHSISFTRTCLW